MKRTNLIGLLFAGAMLGSCMIVLAQPPMGPPDRDMKERGRPGMERGRDLPPPPEIERLIQEAFERGFNRGFEQGFKQGNRESDRGPKKFRYEGDDRGRGPRPDGEFRHGPHGGKHEPKGFRDRGPDGECPMKGNRPGKESFRHEKHQGCPERGCDDFRRPGPQGPPREFDHGPHGMKHDKGFHGRGPENGPPKRDAAGPGPQRPPHEFGNVREHGPHGPRPESGRFEKSERGFRPDGPPDHGRGEFQGREQRGGRPEPGGFDHGPHGMKHDKGFQDRGPENGPPKRDAAGPGPRGERPEKKEFRPAPPAPTAPPKPADE